MTAFKRFKHFKKGCMIPFGFANVGVGYNDHVAGSISGSLRKPPPGLCVYHAKTKGMGHNCAGTASSRAWFQI
jgi:hypothetical protein